MRVLNLVQWKDGIDYRLNRSLCKQWHNFVRERHRNFDLLLQRARAKHSANDVQTLPQNLIKIDVGLTARDATDQDDAATRRHRFETRREIWTTVQIEYEVDSAPAHPAP